MFNLFKPKNPKSKFDWRVLKKNDILILILDERWNALFKNVEKTEDIKEHEGRVKELLKEESRLIAESKEIAAKKKKDLARIIQLTPQAYEDNNEEAKEEMKRCELEIKQINERMKEISDELDNMPKRIREANLQLLESTENSEYCMRKNQKGKGIGKLIEVTKSSWKNILMRKKIIGGRYRYLYIFSRSQEEKS